HPRRRERPHRLDRRRVGREAVGPAPLRRRAREARARGARDVRGALLGRRPGTARLRRFRVGRARGQEERARAEAVARRRQERGGRARITVAAARRRILGFGPVSFMERVKKYLGALDEIFKNAPDKHEANYRSRAVLEEMSGDRAFFAEALERHLRAPGALDARHYPVVGIDIELNPYYGLVANCWIPLPGHESDISTKAIHHHGNMLLSTVTAFGPGYEHWTFMRPEVVDADAEVFEMKLIERAPHPAHHVAFVDSYVAHLPFYPPETSVTYALWSNRFPVTWKDRVKRIPALQKNSEALRRLVVKAGLA